MGVVACLDSEGDAESPEYSRDENCFEERLTGKRFEVVSSWWVAVR